MPKKEMPFDEVIELLNRLPSQERTIEYIRRRGCWPYRPFRGQPIDSLPKHMKDIKRACFTCGGRQPEHAGTCYGNQNCEIWVCAECAADVLTALEDSRNG